MAKKKKVSLHKISINNRQFGELDGTIICLTDELFQTLRNKKNHAGVKYIDLLGTGRAIRGFKHLLEHIKGRGENAQLVLTLGSTKKQNHRYFINYKDYINKGQSRFLSFYRTTGLDVSLSYLNKYFPKDFKSPKDEISARELERIRRNLPEVIDKTTQTKKNQKELIDKTSQKVADLRSEENALKQNVQALRNLLKESSITYYKSKLDELRTRLNSVKTYPETKGRNSWQTWVYDNNWIFGIQYQIPIEKEKVGFDNIPDFLFPTLDGFLDILEIKLPTHDVILEDSSHPGSYVWSSYANKGIGQVVNYIHQMELNQLVLRERINEKYGDKLGIDIYTIKPRSYILIGQSERWKKSKIEALRKLNYSLHGIEVLTYTDLLQRGNNIISLYTKKYE